LVSSARALSGSLKLYTLNADIDIVEAREAIEEVVSPGDGRWAVGIARHDRQLMAVLRDAGGLDSFSPLDKLVVEGLPAGAQSRAIVTNFASWTQCAADSFVRALSLPAGPACHMVWEFGVGRRTFVVPALALMRAMFRPGAQVLVPLFRPQGLEGVCTYVGDNVAFSRRWRNAALQTNLASIVEPLIWMHTFPSARSMAASLYQHALNGEVGLELPRAICRMRMTGVSAGRTFYVTRVVVSSVEPLEAPFEFAERRERFHFTASVSRASPQKGDQETRLPTRNGEASTSDEEWAQLARVLEKASSGAPRYSRRLMLDGILEKVCTGKPWRAVQYRVGDYVTASRQYIRWKSNGVWASVCAVISTRATDDRPALSGRSLPEAAGRQTYTPLSNDEWKVLEDICPNWDRERKHDLRTCLDLILAHAMADKPWNLDEFTTTGLVRSARQSYFRWRQDGTLEKLVSALNELRSNE
jgi:transposase